MHALGNAPHSTQTGTPVMQPSTQPEGGRACKEVGEEAKVRHKRRDATGRQDEPRSRRVTRPGRAPRRGRREEPARDQRGLKKLDRRAKHDLQGGRAHAAVRAGGERHGTFLYFEIL
jgi:hypothetical protein